MGLAGSMPKELRFRLHSQLFRNIPVLLLVGCPQLEVLENLNFANLTLWKCLFEKGFDFLEKLRSNCNVVTDKVSLLLFLVYR